MIITLSNTDKKRQDQKYRRDDTKKVKIYETYPEILKTGRKYRKSNKQKRKDGYEYAIRKQKIEENSSRKRNQKEEINEETDYDGTKRRHYKKEEKKETQK